jgi:intracellular sulfur oxidation DsrE/DsrF family protein
MKTNSDTQANTMAKQIIFLGIIMIALGGQTQASYAADVQKVPQHSVIKDYGKVHPYPGAAMQPSPERHYQVLFDITQAAEAPGKVNPGLDHVARVLNLYALAGVPANHLKIALVVHGQATAIVLKNDAYRKLHQRDNPNSEIFHLLKGAGVKLFICGQALAEKQVNTESVNPEITIAVSALAVLIDYQLDGYALIPN